MLSVLALAAATPKGVPDRSVAIGRRFAACAAAYRASITGKNRNPLPFDCTRRIALQGDADTTNGVVSSAGTARQVALRYIDTLNAEAAGKRGDVLTLSKLQELAAARPRYRLSLCRLYGSLTGGTVDRSNAAICTARDVDAQIDDLLALLKEAGVIPNGR